MRLAEGCIHSRGTTSSMSIVPLPSTSILSNWNIRRNCVRVDMRDERAFNVTPWARAYRTAAREDVCE